MGFLSSLFGDDDVVRLALPPQEHALALAWMQGRSVPDESRLQVLCTEWVELRVDDPFRARLRRAIAEDALSFEIVPRKVAPDPPAEALGQFSEDGWQERFAAADTVVAVRAACDPAWPPVAASLALIAASGLASATGGVVMDPAIPRMLPRAGGDERYRGDGRFLLSDHLFVSISPGRGGRGWLTTLGMSRFSLPEIEIRDVPMDLGSRAAWLAQAIALRVVEASVAAPVDDEDEVRVLEIDAELALRPRDIVVARGGDDETAAHFGRPALARLRFRNARRGIGFLSVAPPRGERAPAAEWLRAALETIVPEEPEAAGS